MGDSANEQHTKNCPNAQVRYDFQFYEAMSEYVL